MTAPERIQVIDSSLRVFVCGLLGLVPVIGLIPAVYSVFAGARLHDRCRNDWNPAAVYLNWGMLIGLASLGLWLLLGSAIFLRMAG